MHNPSDDQLYELVLETLVTDGVLARTAWRTPDGHVIYVLSESFDVAVHDMPCVVEEGRLV
ncbi:MAG: hypothetical protein WAU39_17600 [Polyangiales bacterium]